MQIVEVVWGSESTKGASHTPNMTMLADIVNKRDFLKQNGRRMQMTLKLIISSIMHRSDLTVLIILLCNVSRNAKQAGHRW